MQNIITKKSIISKNYDRKTGKDAWRESLRIAVFASDKIRSTLGPNGSYKIVAYNRGPQQVVKVTKDAIAILDELAVQYPPATIVAEAAKMQREEAGDGVATFVVFLAALLKKADELFSMKIHPNIVIHGYFLATNRALETIDRHATSLNMADHDALDIVDCKRDILKPSMRSKIREAYALACLEGKFEKENIRFTKKPGGSIEESSLIKGIVIKKEKAHPNMPDRMKNLRIAIATEKPGINRLELKKRGQGPVPIKLNLKNALEIERYKETEQRLKLQDLNRLFELEANVLLCEQPLEACVKDKLASNGVFALETVNKKDTEAAAKATGARSVGQLRELMEEDLGVAKELHTEQLGLEKTVTVQGCKGATFLLRGSTPQKIDEAEAAVKNGLTVLKIMGQDSRVLPGSGAAEAEIARDLKSYATSFQSREQLAIQFYGDALMEIPRCLAENYGLNPVDAVLELKKLHANGLCNYGIGEKGCRDAVCLEPARIKRSVIRRAFEVSSLMLRIDELLLSTDIAKVHKKE